MSQVLTDDDDDATATDFDVYALDGNDYVIVKSNPEDGFYSIYGGEGDDFVIMDDNLSTAYFYGGGGVDTLSGGQQGDHLYGNDNSDLLVGGEIDTGSFSNSGAILILDDEPTGDDVLSGDDGRDALYGFDGNDRLYGGDDDDAGLITAYDERHTPRTVQAGLFGGDGDDYLDGGQGDDFLSGGSGADTLIGGVGNDEMEGADGIDRMSGGAGDDLYFIDTASDKVVEAEDDGIDTVYSFVTYTLPSNVENLTFELFSAINGTGNASNNTMIGNDGANVLTGLLGHDTLTGGAGADRFVFKTLGDSTVSSTGRDTIKDFSHADHDRIDLHYIDADTSASGDQAFHFIGATAFGHHAGELRAVSSSSYTLVSGDVNGDAVADFSIYVNKTAFVSADFVL